MNHDGGRWGTDVWYTVPSLIAVISLLIGLILTALSVARERELGTFDQLMVSPLRTHEILIGKTVPPLMIGLVHATVYVLAALFVFEVPLRGSLLLLYPSLIIYLAAVIGVGLFISSLSTTQQQAILGAFLFAAPAILLSGFATPIENMPAWLQPLTMVNPLRHFLVVVKGVFLKGLPASEVLLNTVPLISSRWSRSPPRPGCFVGGSNDHSGRYHGAVSIGTTVRAAPSSSAAAELLSCLRGSPRRSRVPVAPAAESGSRSSSRRSRRRRSR